MPPVWLTEDELRERFGEARIDGLADRDDDGAPDDGVIEAAILDAEGRVKSELLARYDEGDLPASTATAPPTLKRIVAGLAFFNLHRHFDVKPQTAIDERADALAELRAVKQGGASLVLTGSPAVDVAHGVVTTAARSRDLYEQPMTLERMNRWGR